MILTKKNANLNAKAIQHRNCCTYFETHLKYIRPSNNHSLIFGHRNKNFKSAFNHGCLFRDICKVARVAQLQTKHAVNTIFIRTSFLCKHSCQEKESRKNCDLIYRIAGVSGNRYVLGAWLDDVSPVVFI